MNERIDNEALGRVWVKQAQADAERGVLECRVCKRRVDLDRCLTVWRNGVLVFGICDDCAAKHHVIFTPTERGIEVRAKRKEPYVILGGGK
jgi:hypothetical protein